MGMAPWKPSRSNRRYRGASRVSPKEGASSSGPLLRFGLPACVSISTSRKITSL
jgi:hypothetical protein